MKKIFYFLLLLLNSFVFGQKPTINKLEGGFTFNNLTLDTYPSNTNFSPRTLSCAFSNSYDYKYFSFKANFDMTFAFDLISSNTNFRFLIWKLSAEKSSEDVFVGGRTTIEPDRSVEGSANIKGLKSGVTNFCESIFNSSATGYAKAFEGNDLLKEGETIVIAVYGPKDNIFNIKINVAEERTINSLNYKCNGSSYSYQEVYDAVKNDSSLSNIKLYSDTSFNNEINNGATFGTNTTVYAQVKDATGNLQYIYTIPIQFIPEHVFNFKSSFETEYECSLVYTLKKDRLLKMLFPSGIDVSNYIIKTVNGITFREDNQINLTPDGSENLKIIISYTGACPIDSQEVSIPLKQGSPIISEIPPYFTCSSSYVINYDTIYSKLGVDKNQYNLIVTLGGNSISDGNSTTINVGTPLVYQVKIVSKSSGCESNAVNFKVTRTSSVNIVNASISGICLDDFSQTNVDTAINTIQNGNTTPYQLKYYQADGTTEIAQVNLFEYIRANKNGKVIVRALAVDNSNTICDTTVNLTFALSQSSFVKVDNITNYNSTCSDDGVGFTFTKAAIETYLKSKLGNNITAFSGINDISLSDNQSTTISFKVQLNGESCWSDEMQLKLQVITKPNVNLLDVTKTLQADCNNLITINQSVLNELFGVVSTTNYDYEIQHNNSTALTFDSSNEAKISVLFKNKIDNSCFVEKIITVTKKQNLDVDATSLNAYNQSHQIVFCADDETGAKNQIQTLLDYIKTRYATLESLSTVDEIFAKIGLGQGNISITFEDPNYCGQVDIKFYYQQNELPSITVPEKGYVCTGELYVLNFSSQSNYNDYNYIVEKIDGTRVTGIDKYDLEIGTYKVTIENKSTGCSVVKTLVVENSPLPTIEKIVINQKNIIVTAKGSGVLQYALYDNNGNVIINWQRSNTLIIPANLTNSNFVVKVSLDNCGISEESDIIYLDLPNVITPNGDGKNDIWKPMTKSGQANDLTHSYKLIIFDRYGKQILSKEGVNVIEWDGTQNGMILPDDSYWYLLESSKKTGIIQVQYSGSILLKRKI
ncbi:T9SS type B sorting domain-containing protein [Chishuiella sp.]|uniref:T9SS type B sorting domain-containing protein n=1 Tax=Chishuiella sp. TaxID=1969467 RepID=UPI0028B10EAE|nr:T9SS type B sorting domain-containing protein [Chishuiella sp.]